MESRRYVAPEEVLQVQHGAYQQCFRNLLATDCHSQVPGGALLPKQVWQSRGLAGCGICFIWPTTLFPEGRGNRYQAANSQAHFQTVDTAPPKHSVHEQTGDKEALGMTGGTARALGWEEMDGHGWASAHHLRLRMGEDVVCPV